MELSARRGPFQRHLTVTQVMLLSDTNSASAIAEALFPFTLRRSPLGGLPLRAAKGEAKRAEDEGDQEQQSRRRRPTCDGEQDLRSTFRAMAGRSPFTGDNLWLTRRCGRPSCWRRYTLRGCALLRCCYAGRRC